MTFKAPPQELSSITFGGGGGGAHDKYSRTPITWTIKGNKIQFELSEFELTKQVKVTEKWGEIQGNWT